MLHQTYRRHTRANFVIGVTIASAVGALLGGCPAPTAQINLPPIVAGTQDDAGMRPVAQGTRSATTLNAPVRIALPATSPAGEPLIFSIVTPPGAGSLSQLESTAAGGFVTFTPLANFAGKTQFLYVATGASGSSDPGLAVVDVLPPVFFSTDVEEGDCPFNVRLLAFPADGYTLPDVQYCWAFNEELECGTVSSQGTLERTRAVMSRTVVTLGLMVAGSTQAFPATHVGTGEHSVTIECNTASDPGGENEQPGGDGSPTNIPPVARAGDDQSHVDSDGDGQVQITLDGSASHDPDGAIVSYHWYKQGTQIASGKAATVALGVGVHMLTLTVTDNQEANASDEVQITVGAQGRLSLTPDTGMIVSGPVGGPFTPTMQKFTLRNDGAEPISWSASASQGWVLLDKTSGTLTPDESAVVTATLTAGVNMLPGGTHSSQVSFQNGTNGAGSTVRTIMVTATAPDQFFVSGRVTDSGGAGIAGVALSGLPGNPQTNTDGQYVAIVQTGFTATVTPSKDGHTFFPVSRNYNGLNANRVNDDYLAHSANYAISGFVRDATGSGISGVVMNGLPGNPQTNASGFYTANVSHGWTGTVTPTKSGYEFGPPSRAFQNVSGDQAHLRYYGGITQTATSVSSNGITWTFDKDYRVGLFANGDPWVSPDAPGGTVTVVSVNPPPTIITQTDLNNQTPKQFTINGSAINPAWGNQQSYDQRPGNWVAGPSYPLSLVADRSLVSTISWIKGEPNCPTMTATVPYSPRPAIRAAAVLTCLGTPPAPDALRPPYVGTAKPLLYARDMDLSNLPSLPLVANLPTAATAIGWMRRPWIDHLPTWWGDYLHPSESLPHYPRDFAARYNDAVLMLMLAIPMAEKQDIALHAAQIGQDMYHVLLAGGTWGSNGGGHALGRKWPILFAGLMFNHSGMKGIGTSHGVSRFGEDCQTFYVTQPYLDYHTAQGNTFHVGWAVGSAQWGERHCTQWQNDHQSRLYRDCCTNNAWHGAALAARMLDAKGLWNANHFFDEVDAYMPEFPPGDYRRSWSKFAEAMWDAYRNSYP